MRQRSEPARRLLVSLETSHATGVFELDERLRVERVVQRSVEGSSSARVSVRLDEAFDSVEARRRYHPDRRIVVTTDEADAAAREILFIGYPPLHTARWDGRIEREDEYYEFEAEDMLERVAAARRAWVYGRRMRTGAIEDGLQADPTLYADQSELVTALPCVFNPDGVGNRAAERLSVTTKSGECVDVPIFTWDGDRLARRWTYGDVIRYLVWFHLADDGRIASGNVFAATEDAGGSDGLSNGLRREPVSLACEAVNLAEALSLVCDSAGIRYTADTVNDAGRPVTSLRLWSPEDGEVKAVYLARGGRHEDGSPRYDTSARSVGQILRENNTYRGEVTWDQRRAAVAPTVLGGVKRYEMTLALKPGWVPRPQLDNVASADRLAAKAAALTPAQVEALGSAAEASAWFQRYHRQGSLFMHDASVCRMWVLNEDGWYSGGAYTREAPPFDDYAAFDFAAVCDASLAAAGSWTRRARRLLPAISRTDDDHALGVWVEVSFDSGTTWQQQSAGVRVLDDRIGVYLEAENPTEIAPAGADPHEQNMWYALVDGTFRVRATGVVESDERLVGSHVPAPSGAVISRVEGMVTARPAAFQFVTRSGTENVLVGVSSLCRLERDDSAAIDAAARILSRVHGECQMRALPTVPWVETGYAIGDRIGEVRGRHLRLATSVGRDGRWPAVIERRFERVDGRYETVLVVGASGARPTTT